MKKLAILSAAFIALCSFVSTGYNVGDKAMDFKLKNVDGKMISMSDYPNAKGFIVVFTCNHCPFAKAYENRIIALNNMYAPKGYYVIAINPNDPTQVDEDSYANMQVRAKAKNYTFPYVIDETQEVAHAFGAAHTPHVFVLQKSGKDYIVKYIGAIDDNSDSETAVKQKYVEDAVNNLLAGKPVNPASTKAIGCGIKWKS
ncbi:MAG TPA: thioredoxin family protein [Bacteroidia bacterium]|nr:thioredoxin family protein [Bacteroidia bacterium]